MKPAIQFCRSKVIYNRKNITNYVILNVIIFKVWVSNNAVCKNGQNSKHRNILTPLRSILVSLLRKEVWKGEFGARQKNEWKYEQILPVIKSGYIWVVHLKESLHCAPGTSYHEVWVACRRLVKSHRIGWSHVCAPTTEPGRGCVMSYKMGKSDIVRCKDWDEILVWLDKRNISRTTAWKLQRQRKSCMLCMVSKIWRTSGSSGQGLAFWNYSRASYHLLDARSSGHVCK